MAENKVVKVSDLFDALERNWIKKALETQRTSLARARSKEVVGSEIHELRGKELGSIDALIRKMEV